LATLAAGTTGYVSDPVLHSITERNLQQPLGPWDQDILAKWKWLYLAVEDRVYYFEGISWRVFLKVPSRGQCFCSLRFLGVSGSLSIIKVVCVVHNVQTGLITIQLGRKKAMIATSDDWPLNPECLDYDLLTNIRAKVL
jgi:hypothetical protein